jgi:hypothetical protein
MTYYTIYTNSQTIAYMLTNRTKNGKNKTHEKQRKTIQFTNKSEKAV